MNVLKLYVQCTYSFKTLHTVLHLRYASQKSYRSTHVCMPALLVCYVHTRNGTRLISVYTCCLLRLYLHMFDVHTI